MVICLHMRLRSITPALTGSKKAVEELNSYRERITIDLADPSSSALGKMRRLSQPLETDPVISLEKSALFPIGAAFPFGQDLIGYTWRKNEPLILRHDDYIESFQPVKQPPFPLHMAPSSAPTSPILRPQF